MTSSSGSHSSNDGGSIESKEQKYEESEGKEEMGFYGHIMKKKDVQLSAEEREALEEEKNLNIQSVMFKEPNVKEIISPHSFSILAKADPKVELADPVVLKARQVFQEFLEKEGSGVDVVSLEQIVPMLVKMGYDFDRTKMKSVVNRMARHEEYDMDEWCMFLEDYQAPAYHYGQCLRMYCGRNEIDKVEELVIRGCDINTGDGEGLTPLHYASELNHVRIIDILSKLSNGKLNINAQDKYGWTPLHSACHHGNIDAVHALLKLNAKIDITDIYGKTPLHFAAAQARNRICDVLLAKNKSLLNQGDVHGMTPLHETSYKARESTYAILGMASGVDTSCKDVLGNTPAAYTEPF